MCQQDNKLMISIIAPVYQVEAYLLACVESILAQTYENWELILVDDGSKDNSGSLCDAYASKDCRIRVHHQPNGGVSAARNAGLDLARGAYIAFVDSDDMIKPDYLEILHRNLTEKEADIACCCAVAPGGEIPVNEILPLVINGRIIRDRAEICADIAANQEIYWSCIWGKLIRADLARKYRFRPMRYGEDGLYMYQLFSQNPVVHLDTYEGYYYVNRSTSVMNVGRRRNLTQLRNELELDFYRWSNLPQVDVQTNTILLDRCAQRIHNYAYTRAAMNVKEKDDLLEETLQVVIDRCDNLSAQMRRNMILLKRIPWLYRLVAKLKDRKAK